MALHPFITSGTLPGTKYQAYQKIKKKSKVVPSPKPTVQQPVPQLTKVALPSPPVAKTIETVKQVVSFVETPIKPNPISLPPSPPKEKNLIGLMIEAFQNSSKATTALSLGKDLLVSHAVSYSIEKGVFLVDKLISSAFNGSKIREENLRQLTLHIEQSEKVLERYREIAPALDALFNLVHDSRVDSLHRIQEAHEMLDLKRQEALTIEHMVSHLDERKIDEGLSVLLQEFEKILSGNKALIFRQIIEERSQALQELDEAEQTLKATQQELNELVEEVEGLNIACSALNLEQDEALDTLEQKISQLDKTG